MTQQPEPSGDYGYDLVHEEVSRGKARAGTTGPQPQGATPGGPPDAGQDYSYDEAHDF